VGVAQAIIGKPRLLILDEPTNGLDPQQTDHMRRLIQRLARQATVILSTHIMQEVDAICDRVLVLRHGKLALDDRLDNLRQSRTVLLRTDNSVDSLAAFLRKMPQVEALQQHADGEGRSRYTLTLRETADMDTAANNLARCVIEAGARLYQLRPVVKGLETVFHEVNSDVP
jgi:ABC-2 type transport system ATP-binding protein